MSNRVPRVGIRTLVVAALAGVPIGVGLVLLGASTSSPRAPDLASMDQVTVEDAPDAVAPADTPGAEPAPNAERATASPSGDSPDGAPKDPSDTAAVDACLAAARLADDAVAGARTALGNWKTHYGAQLAFDAGRIDGDEAKRRWSVSKEPAERNINTFIAARDAMTTDDPCGDLDAEQMSTGERRRAQRCSARASAAVQLMTDTQPALDDWLTHLEMMATRDEYPVDEYLEIWRQAVADAPDAMRTFENAVDVYDETGACPKDATAMRPNRIATQVTLAADVDRGGTPQSTCMLAPAPALARGTHANV